VNDDDAAELPFTLFVATAQLIVGIGLIAFATSAAVRIIGVVVIAFALLTGGSAWYHARRRGQRLFGGWFEELGEERPEEAAPQSSQGPRQPPTEEVRRSASSGPQEPGS
jgi:hypothetical protein